MRCSLQVIQSHVRSLEGLLNRRRGCKLGRFAPAGRTYDGVLPQKKRSDEIKAIRMRCPPSGLLCGHTVRFLNGSLAPAAHDAVDGPSPLHNWSPMEHHP